MSGVHPFALPSAGEHVGGRVPLWFPGPEVDSARPPRSRASFGVPTQVMTPPDGEYPAGAPWPASSSFSRRVSPGLRPGRPHMYAEESPSAFPPDLRDYAAEQDAAELVELRKVVAAQQNSLAASERALAASQERCTRCRSALGPVSRRPHTFSVSFECFCAAIAPGFGHRVANFVFAPSPKRVVLNACARRMRLWVSSHALEPGGMYTSVVFVYTTASDFSNPARGPTVFTGVVAS